MNIKIYFVFFLSLLLLTGCQKKIVIAEVNFNKEGNKAIYKNIRDIKKKVFYNTSFIIKLKNDTNFSLEILSDSNYGHYYGIGCHAFFESKLNSNFKPSQIKVFPDNTTNLVSNFTKFLEYKDSYLSTILAHEAGKKINIGPKKEHDIRIIFNEKDLFVLNYDSKEIFANDIAKIYLSSKNTFDDLWSIRLFPHIIFVYRFLNLPNIFKVEHKSRVYTMEELSDPLLKNVDDVE